MKHIVLVHGVLGFSSIGFDGLDLPEIKIPAIELFGFHTPEINTDKINVGEFTIANYFIGVKQALEELGYNVIVPDVSPVATVEDRAKDLYDRLKKIITTHKEDFPKNSIAIFAHSMGGLDAREALTLEDEWLAKYVNCLVTIGTPHLGSPVAEFLAKENPVTSLVYKKAQLVFGDAVGALKNLTPAFCESFDVNTKNVAGVKYYSIAGVIDETKGKNYSTFFESLGAGFYKPNDGVVSVDSAKKDKDGWSYLDDWYVDHAGLVGWFEVGLDIVKSRAAHLERYRELAKKVFPLIDFPN